MPGHSGESGVWARNYWLSGLNYLHVARAALDCSAYLSAVVYADIWDAIQCSFEIRNKVIHMILSDQIYIQRFCELAQRLEAG